MSVIKFPVFIAIMVLLQGCTIGYVDKNEKGKIQVDGTVKNVQVLEKREKNYFRAGSEYFVRFGNETQKVEFQVTEPQYNMLQEGLVVNVSYNSNTGEVVKFTFPNLEGEK